MGLRRLGTRAIALAVALGLAGSGGAASSGAATPGDDPATPLFSPAAVAEIDLTLPQDSLDALNGDPDEYQDGTLSLATSGDEQGPLDVGIRLKGGAGSFRPLSGKAAFKVKLGHSVSGQRLLGLKTLTLNNMVQDQSMVHELLAYEVFRSAGVAAPRTGYAYVRVNEQDYGLYLNVETPDSVMLPRWFDTTRHLYEGEYGTDVSPGGAGAFEVDQGSETNLSDLEALIASANGDGGDWSDGVQGVADLQQLTRMWAVEKYVGHWDGYAGYGFSGNPNNYYLHSDSAGMFTMLPWGTDQTWGPTPWGGRLAFDGEAGLLFNECLDDASCLALYRDAVRDVRSLVGALDLDSLAASTAALLAPWQEQDPRREYSLSEIQAAVDATREYIATRPGDADGWLAAGEPPDDTPPQTLVADPEPDVQAPDTAITNVSTNGMRSRHATFEFTATSTQAIAGFDCSLDGAAFVACTPPHTVKVMPGRHTFSVRATDLGARADATPATFDWRVKQKKRH